MNNFRRLVSCHLTVGMLSLLVPKAVWSQPVVYPDSEARQPSSTGWAKVIEELMHRGDVPGLSIAVIREGKIIWKHPFGQKNAIKDGKTDGPVRDDTLFPAASLSKPVFAYIALRLTERGTL